VAFGEFLICYSTFLQNNYSSKKQNGGKDQGFGSKQFKGTIQLMGF